MIALLKGTISKLDTHSAIVCVDNVGYIVSIPLTTYSTIKELHETGIALITLYVETIMRDSSIELYGFKTEREKDFFNLVRNVTKIGVRIALNIVSTIEYHEFCNSIHQHNITRLVKIPGIGKTTAERLCMELKTKLPNTDNSNKTEENPQTNIDTRIQEDTIGALVHLGYKKSDAKTVIQTILTENSHINTLDVLLREALKKLLT